MKTNIPATQNEPYGFYGTMNLERHSAGKAWPMAMKAIANATGENMGFVRAFLDSRHGRHFADDVCNGIFHKLTLKQAIDAAIERWMGWTINKATSRETGIPEGLPYLTGFVIDEGMYAENEEN